MASSGYKSVAATDHDTLKFSWSEVSQSVANNTTTIDWEMQLIADSYGKISSTASKDWSVTVNGKKYSGTNKIAISNNSTITLASGTTTITHNSDGKKTFSYSFRQELAITFSGEYVGTISGSSSGTLNTIARASQPSCVTYPEHTQNVGEFGDTISIHMNRKSSAFTHTVRYAYGSLSGTIAEGVGTGTTWTIPLSFMDLIPENTSGSGTIYVDTYSGSTKIGTKSCGFTATVPASIKPSCSLALDDVTGIDDIYGSPVKGLSRIKVTVSAELAYSSPIASYSISVNGVKYSGETVTTGLLMSSGDVPVNVTVTDKRGRSASASYTMKVQDYTAPAVTKLTATRCNQDGTANRRGSYVKVTFSATVSSMSNKNTATYILKYKKTSAESYSQVIFSDLANNYAPENYTYIFAAATGNSYNVVIEAVDRHNALKPSTKSAKAPTASAIFSWRGFKTDSGKQDGAGIGKVPEKPNTLQVGWETEFENDVKMVGAHAFYGSQGLIDTRDANETPEWYMTNHGRGVVWEFKVLTAIEFRAPSETYGTLQTIIPWADSSGGLPKQVVYEGGIRWTRIGTSLTSWGAWVSDLLRAYPVGSIYLSYNHTNPGTLFGGTWERIENAFLWAVDSSGTIGQTGGEKTHTLTIDEIPSHSHGSVYSGMVAGTKDTAWLASGGDKMNYGALYAGGGKAHNNMPPYIQVSVWRRTA